MIRCNGARVTHLLISAGFVGSWYNDASAKGAYMFLGLFIHGYDPCTSVMQLENSAPVAFPMESVASQLVDTMHHWSTVGTLDTALWPSMFLTWAGQTVTRFSDIQQVVVRKNPSECLNQCDHSACVSLEAVSNTQTSILAGGIYEQQNAIRMYARALPLSHRWQVGKLLVPNASHWNGKVRKDSAMCGLTCSVLHLHDMQRAPEEYDVVPYTRHETMVRCMRDEQIDVLRTALGYAQDMGVLEPLLKDVLSAESFIAMANSKDVVGLRLAGCNHNSPYPYQYVNWIRPEKTFSVDHLDQDCIVRHFLSALNSNAPHSAASSSTFNLSTTLDNELWDEHASSAVYSPETDEIMANWTNQHSQSSDAMQICGNDDAKWRYYQSQYAALNTGDYPGTVLLADFQFGRFCQKVGSP